ncbi:hypothetical protein MA16_Dca028625 [Dendrobium catenatum]|uniref:Uncharacterized protein n=1 Tax=Dendrobium catenatum TaxID=906689 RepID=A0A2I0VFZ3_9ASPA|nr:hypothetical protein MA16_Dca028625 [Dendrobium catenatum]
MRLEDHKESRGDYPTSDWKNMKRELGSKYISPTCGHPSISNIRIAAPPYRSSPKFKGRPSIGSSDKSISYGSPLGPTSSHPIQPLDSPFLDPAGMIVIKECIKKKRSPEPENECIHFVDANDINNDEEFFEDETTVIESDSQHDLNPELGKLEPLNVDTLGHPDPSLLEDNSLNKVCLDDGNVILKEATLASNTLKLSLEDRDLVVTPTELTLDNLDDNNLESEVVKLNLLPDLSPNLTNPESINLKVIPKSNSIDDRNRVWKTVI